MSNAVGFSIDMAWSPATGPPSLREGGPWAVPGSDGPAGPHSDSSKVAGLSTAGGSPLPGGNWLGNCGTSLATTGRPYRCPMWSRKARPAALACSPCRDASRAAMPWACTANSPGSARTASGTRRYQTLAAAIICRETSARSTCCGSSTSPSQSLAAVVRTPGPTNAVG